MTRKILEINDPCSDLHLICIYNTRDPFNPYTVYKTWYDMGKHRRKLGKYTDLTSVIVHIYNIMTGHDHT